MREMGELGLEAVHQFEATYISEDSLHDIFSGLD
jgi:hypothetical protein